MLQTTFFITLYKIIKHSIMWEGPYLYTKFWNIATVTLCYKGLWSVLAYCCQFLEQPNCYLFDNKILLSSWKQQVPCYCSISLLMHSCVSCIEAVLNCLLVVIFWLILSLVITFKIRYNKVSDQLLMIIQLLSALLPLLQNKSLERAKNIMEFDT
jgi:hypothetical protein